MPRVFYKFIQRVPQRVVHYEKLTDFDINMLRGWDYWLPTNVRDLISFRLGTMVENIIREFGYDKPTGCSIANGP